MKKATFIIFFILFASCDKEDDCDCYYSEEFNQYLPDERWEKALMENPTTQERMNALNAECRNKGCE